MTHDSTGGYTRKQWFVAVNLVALLGCAGFLAPTVLRAPTQTLSVLLPALLVALFVTWVVIAGPLAVLMRRPATWKRAAIWGAAFAATLAFVGFAVAQINRWTISVDPDRYSQIGGGDFVREVDGVLTPYGWQVLLFNNLLFIGLGICVALAVRAIIGPGKVPA